MAMDQAMLEYAASTQQVVLRIYQWSQPTVSLGYFQAYDDLDAYPELKSLDCVRRLTGGGAILHDCEWTYSIAVPGELNNKGHSELLYRSVHRAIVDWLIALGFPAKLWEEANREKLNSYPTTDSFLCFKRRSEVDIVIEDRKVVGSAQRRNSSGLLQHGSLLIEASKWVPQIGGVLDQSLKVQRDELDQQLTVSKFSDVIQNGLKIALDCEWTVGKADENIRERAKKIASERFGLPSWTQFKKR